MALEWDSAGATCGAGRTGVKTLNSSSFSHLTIGRLDGWWAPVGLEHRVMQYAEYLYPSVYIKYNMYIV